MKKKEIKVRKFVSGFFVCGAVTGAAFLLSFKIPGIGSVTLSLLLGLIWATLVPGSVDAGSEGIAWIEKNLLPAAIVLMGWSVHLSGIYHLGLRGIGVVVFSVGSALAVAFILGPKAFGFNARMSLLVGSGNGICGTSAVSGVARVINASDEELGTVIPVINLLGAAGIALLPFLMTVFRLSSLAGGMLIGGSLQAVGHVAAAGFMMGDKVGETAILVKMARVLLLGPVMILVSLLVGRKSRGETDIRKKQKFPIPVFILLFLLLVFGRQKFSLPPGGDEMIHKLENGFMMLAMAAIGLRNNLKRLLIAGPKVFSFAACVWGVQIAVLLGILFYV